MSVSIVTLRIISSNYSLSDVLNTCVYRILLILLNKM